MFREGHQELDVALLRGAVKAAIGTSVGDEVDAHPSGFRYQVTSGPWQLTTRVALTSKPTYVHYIRAGESRSLAEGISLMSWCGFSGQTVWDRCGRGDEAQVAQVLRKVALDFVSSWRDLVDGLQP